jgi:hypothetical protein
MGTRKPPSCVGVASTILPTSLVSTIAFKICTCRFRSLTSAHTHHLVHWPTLHDRLHQAGSRPVGQARLPRPSPSPSDQPPPFPRLRARCPPTRMTGTAYSLDYPRYPRHTRIPRLRGRSPADSDSDAEFRGSASRPHPPAPGPRTQPGSGAGRRPLLIGCTPICTPAVQVRAQAPNCY